MDRRAHTLRIGAAVALVLGVGATLGVLLRQDTVDSAQLQGDWDLVTLEVGGERIPIPDEYGWIGIRFSQRGEWSGDFCNHKTGKYRTKESSIEITIRFTTTIGCSGALKRLEEAVEEAFTPGLNDYTLSGDLLRLQLKDAVIVFDRRTGPADH